MEEHLISHQMFIIVVRSVPLLPEARRCGPGAKRTALAELLYGQEQVAGALSTPTRDSEHLTCRWLIVTGGAPYRRDALRRG